MHYTDKKRQVLRALENADLRDIFSVTQENSEGVLIQTEQNMAGGRCVISLELQDRPFHGIYYSLGTLNNLARKEAMIELLNGFNEENLLLKFYLDNRNSIMAQVMYIARDNYFNADEYVALISPAFNAIQDQFYSKIMRVMWG